MVVVDRERTDDPNIHLELDGLNIQISLPLHFKNYGYGGSGVDVAPGVSLVVAQSENKVKISRIDFSLISKPHVKVELTANLLDDANSQFVSMYKATFAKQTFFTQQHQKFRIFTSDTAEGYAAFQLIDVRHSQDLSSLLANKKLTNVRFQVVDQVISAHRAVISARSPILAALLATHFGKEDECRGTINIPSMQPNVFRAFLQFIYTGKLMGLISLRDRQLVAAAEGYQVQTLVSLCHASANGPSIYEDILKTALF